MSDASQQSKDAQPKTPTPAESAGLLLSGRTDYDMHIIPQHNSCICIRYFLTNSLIAL